MKKLSIIAIVIAATVLAQSCSDVKRTPSKVYMPDMAYSRAYETYADHSNLADSGIFYNNRPVAGTIKRGDTYHYEILKDTTGTYNNAANMKNPLPVLDSLQMVEAERLYLVNCGICHGQKLDGKGPLHTRADGDGPYTPAPANFVSRSYMDGKYYSMTDGTMFHSITYGKNLMGSYASQVTPKQRWMIIDYIRTKQTEKPAAPAAAATATKAPAAATTAAPAAK